MDLFSSEKLQQQQILALPDADISYIPNFFTAKTANNYFEIFMEQIAWQQDDITVFGKTYKQPRLTALYGEDGKNYRYSNITMQPKKFTKELIEIKEQVEAVSKSDFNAVLLNLYRNGQDSNGWHSDDEKELGKNPTIASVSLGAKRKFKLRHKQDKTKRFDLYLEHGSLLVMKGCTQHLWHHQIPKTRVESMPRINLTFRFIYH